MKHGGNVKNFFGLFGVRNMNRNSFVWVFDLDGTLWKENSHVFIVERHLGYKKYTNVLARLWCKIDFFSYMVALNKDYLKVSKEEIDAFLPSIIKITSGMLTEAKNNNEQVIILSSAPSGIVKKAEKLFGVPSYHADIGKKANKLLELLGSNKDIYVVTDNLSDLDLIELSAKTYFRVTRAGYKKKLIKYQDKIVFLNKGIKNE